MDSFREALNLAEQFAAAGRTWVELDDDGNVVNRGGRNDEADGTIAAFPEAVKARRASVGRSAKSGTTKKAAKADAGPGAAKASAVTKKVAAPSGPEDSTARGTRATPSSTG